eukprot:51794-Eustigmatos_ZCMA.PRE.1
MEKPFVLGVVDVKNRMSILRLKNATFAIYSPISPTPECVDKVLNLTANMTAQYIILPNG